MYIWLKCPACLWTLLDSLVLWFFCSLLLSHVVPTLVFYLWPSLPCSLCGEYLDNACSFACYQLLLREASSGLDLLKFPAFSFTYSALLLVHSCSVVVVRWFDYPSLCFSFLRVWICTQSFPRMSDSVWPAIEIHYILNE